VPASRRRISGFALTAGTGGPHHRCRVGVRYPDGLRSGSRRWWRRLVTWWSPSGRSRTRACTGACVAPKRCLRSARCGSATRGRNAGTPVSKPPGASQYADLQRGCAHRRL